MPQKKRQSVRKSEPKIFRCTGFGDCNMVFTRSEHLARHARKHTGEKPFKCVVPNCDRMFSRFDNMMQHTHTHSHTKKKDSSDLPVGMLTSKSMPEDNSMMHAPALPNSPISSFNEHQKVLPRSFDKPTMYCAQPYGQTIRPPSPVSDEDCAKFQTPYYSYSQPIWNPMYNTPTTSPQLYHPITSTGSITPTPFYSPCSSETGSYSPEYVSSSSFTDYYRNNSIQSETQRKRRLSRDELLTPIRELNISNSYSPPSAQKDQGSFSSEGDYNQRQMSIDSNVTTNATAYKSIDGVDITQDEYEALQGFSKLCAQPVVSKEHSPITLPPLNESRAIVLTCYANLFSRVHAFRQLVSTVPESFQRGSI
ncbi:hypothetical protein INT48_008144 [Thamnidium elegans]|uniref:C2H2-type domain-containing protein n=1 Tax=Thamnidium elegans TaxID=101142 RepID=A0A8H7STJ2_9FUNG|nr:hypothetical protein INT48_008144 [Thamnidium elegans]